MINYTINNELNYLNNKNNDIYNLIITARNNILQSEKYNNNVLIKNLYIFKPKKVKKNKYFKYSYKSYIYLPFYTNQNINYIILP